LEARPRSVVIHRNVDGGFLGRELASCQH
jgi:hypothetical protein